MVSQAQAAALDIEMASAIQPFRIFDLPPELRVMIYEHCFHDIGTSRNILAKIDFSPVKALKRDLALIQKMSGMLCASHDVMIEAVPTFKASLQAMIGTWAELVRRYSCVNVQWLSAVKKKHYGINYRNLRYGEGVLKDCLAKWMAIANIITGEWAYDGAGTEHRVTEDNRDGV